MLRSSSWDVRIGRGRCATARRLNRISSAEYLSVMALLSEGIVPFYSFLYSRLRNL